MSALKAVLRISLFLLCFGNFISYSVAAPSALEDELLDACEFFDLATVQKLIKKPGIDVNKGDENGCTPLIMASQNRAFDIVEELLSLKKSDGSPAVDVNQANMHGVTALLAACKKNSLHTVRLLLEVPGIDVNLSDNDGETPLLAACKISPYQQQDGAIISALLTDGATNTANKKGETPLEITKDTPIHCLLEYWLIGEIHESKYCSALSAEYCKAGKERDCKERDRKRALQKSQS